MVFIRAPLLVPLVLSVGDACFTGSVFQGLQSTTSVLSREVTPVKFTKRSKKICSLASDFHIYQHHRFTLLLRDWQVLTSICVGRNRLENCKLSTARTCELQK